MLLRIRAFRCLVHIVRLAVMMAVGTSVTAAQESPYLPFYSKDTTQAAQLAAEHRAAIKKHFVVPKAGSSDYRNDYRKIVESTSQEVYNSIRYTAFLDPVINPFVQQVFQQITQVNPQLPPTRLVLTKNPETNAYAVGNGTVVFHLGLLPKLENESQVAFIICHELAHVYLKHMETGIDEHLTRIHSKEFKQDVQRIIAEEYNIQSKIKALAMGMALNSNYHRRKFERQADSLGYVLLARTHYDPRQAYRALELLDTIDKPDSAEAIDLAKYFNCADYASLYGQKAAKPKSIFTVQAAAPTALEQTDTLKSHPDCQKRMRYIRRLAREQVAEGPQAAPSAAFARVRAASRLEVVQSWFDYDCYDRALFGALLLLREQPQNAYLRSVVLLSLYELREHMQNHTYFEVVSNVSKHNPENFNQILSMLSGLHLPDFEGMGSCFAQNLPAPAATDEYTLAARYAAAAFARAPDQARALKQQYQQQYQGGRFETLLFPTKKKSHSK